MYRSQPIVITLLLLYVSLNTSCKQKEKKWDNQQALLETLTENILYYHAENVAINKELEEGLFDRTRSNAAYWIEVADKITLQFKQTELTIEKLRLSKEPDEDSLKAIYGVICQYRDSVLSADTDLATVFLEKLAALPGQMGHLFANSREFYAFYFSERNIINNRIQLSKLLCDLININNYLLRFCNRRSMPGCILRFDSYSTLVGINTEVTNPGGKINVQAGLGYFSRNSETEIWIDDKQVSLNSEAFAKKTLFAPSKPGTYKIPIVIISLNQISGMKDTIRHDLVYKVVPICDN